MANILRCVFGHAYTDIPNHIPLSVGITTQGMLAFFLFWLVHFPFCAFRPYQLRGFFWFKSIIVLPAVWGLFIFCMVNTKGNVGSVYASKITSSKGWFIMYAINSGMGNTATLITNQPDIARWSKTNSGAQWSQLATQPLSVTLSATLGILSTAAINNSWNLELWNPWDLLGAILDRYWSASTRFAVFLSAFVWMVSILGTNIAANMIPFGSDSSMLLPRYITIPRGQYIVEFLAFAICPWKILSSASVFTTFLSGYGLFMASVVAIMICDCEYSYSRTHIIEFSNSPLQIISSQEEMSSSATSTMGLGQTDIIIIMADGTFKVLLPICVGLLCPFQASLAHWERTFQRVRLTSVGLVGYYPSLSVL
jgi:NCS1 family nucleobase:cation symporter-1